MTTHSLPKVAYGKGSYVYDTDGKQYIDGSGGPALFCLGHSHAEVNEAIKSQLDLIAHGYRNTFTSDPLEQLTELVQSVTGMSRVLFSSSGSEAMESAMKLALQYHHVQGQTRRKKFISRKRSYHGNTLGVLSLSGFYQRREPYEGSLLPVSHLSAANAYRPPIDSAGGDLVAFCVAELAQEIDQLGAENIAAFVFEPVVGAAGGAVPAPPGYAKQMQAVCEKYGVLVIADEVMCGSGRCGTWRALEHDGVTPDIMAAAKGLGGGYVPLGATIYSQKISDVIDHKADGPVTGHTFSGHTLGCAASLAVQQIIQRDRLIERVAELGVVFQDNLRSLIGASEFVGDIRGRGFFVGVEIVADRETKQPFDPKLKLFQRIQDQAFEAGLICYATGGTVDGINGDTIILSPPYNATESELDEIVDKFGIGLNHALS